MSGSLTVKANFIDHFDITADFCKIRKTIITIKSKILYNFLENLIAILYMYLEKKKKQMPQRRK